MTPNLKALDEQVVVITGASSGIGLVTARMAAERGVKVVAAARSADALQRLVEEIRAGGGEAVAVTADVGSESDVARIAETAITAFGGFDTWVNNAGVSIFGRIEEVSTEDMRRMFDTVYWGVVYGSRAAVRHFRSRGPGAIVNVGSLFGDRATPLQSTYASAKHAVHGFTDALRMELEADDAPVSVTLVHPGRIDTPYNEHAQTYVDREPAHRVMVYAPETVAEAILHAAAHPVRDLYIGTQAKAVAVLGRLAPRLTDLAMERYLFPMQLDPDRPAHPRAVSGLHQPGRHAFRERGSHRGWKRSRSLYLTAERHPRASAAAIAGTAVALAAAAAHRAGSAGS
jgi:short-subunit dehydrogenase